MSGFTKFSCVKSIIECAILLVGLAIVSSCSATRKTSGGSPDNRMNLETLLNTQPENFKSLIDNKDSFRLQIIYTQIDRDAQNNPVFTDHTFNLNPKQYFYPASTVKMPVALLALEKLNELKHTGINKHTIMVTDSSYPKQETIYNHPNANDGKPSIAQYIKEIFLVSDNDAYNRLYEFLGQEYINDRLQKKGYPNTEILHRLSIPLSVEENRHTNAITFFDTSGTQLYQQPPKYNSRTYSARNDKLGKGFYKSGSLITEPFDFSSKNRISLADLHNILKAVIFPKQVNNNQRFNLSDDDYKFLYTYMSATPAESKLSVYDSSIYHSGYVKFLLLGAQPSSDNNIRIFNKVGDAYGFLTDVAYVVDFDNKVEFMVSATILCNSDEIFNDDKYEYNTVGFPFMKNLGRLIYEHEKQRKKKYLPDLSNFKINYKELD